MATESAVFCWVYMGYPFAAWPSRMVLLKLEELKEMDRLRLSCDDLLKKRQELLGSLCADFLQQVLATTISIVFHDLDI